MADKPEKTSPAGEPTDASPETNDKPKRRVLRSAPAAEKTPATFREQSQQAQARAIRPRKRSKVGHAAGAPFRLIGRLFRPLGRFKFFRVIGYILAPPYIRNAFKELRLVTWPNAQTTRQLTFAVIAFSLVFGVIVAGVDWGLDKIFRALILK